MYENQEKVTGNQVAASPDSGRTLEPKQSERKNDVEQKPKVQTGVGSKTNEAESKTTESVSDGNGKKERKEHKPYEPTPKVIRQVLTDFFKKGGLAVSPAIKALLDLAEMKDRIQDASPEPAKVISIYMSRDYKKTDSSNQLDVCDHRLRRGTNLLDKTETLFTPGEMSRLYSAINIIALDPNAVNSLLS